MAYSSGQWTRIVWAPHACGWLSPPIRDIKDEWKCAPTGNVRGTSVYEAERSPPGSDAGFSLLRRPRFPGDVVFNGARGAIIKNCFSGDKVIKLYIYHDAERQFIQTLTG